MLCLQNAATKTYPDSTTAVSVGVHADFFRGLARDETLREELRIRPVETLASFGIHLDASQLPSSVTLPPPETLAILVDPPRLWAGFFDA